MLFLKPKKKFGQCFLRNNKICKNIMELINDYSCDNYIEIGPGTGQLTKYFFKKNEKKYTGIEIDVDLFIFLEKKFPQYNFINDNFIDFFKTVDTSNNFYFGNLPFNLSNRIILDILFSEKWKHCLFMVQKEVGNRIIAKFGSRHYNKYSVLCQLFSNCEKKIIVSKSEFFPKPKVDGMIIMFTKKNNKYKNKKPIINFIKNCFMYRRKTLFNNLKKKYNLKLLLKVMDKYNLSKIIRAQDISPEIIEKIGNEII